MVYKRKNYKRNYSKSNSLASKVNALEKRVRKDEPDVKLLSWNSGYSTISSVGSMQNLTGIAQGTDVNQRIGNTIQPLRLNLTLTAELSSPSVVAFQPVRFIIFRDNQQQPDTAPTMSDLLFTPSDGVFSKYTFTQQKRFSVLYDHRVLLQPQMQGQWIHDVSIDLSKHKMIFNGSSGTDIQKNGIYMLIVSDQLITIPYFKYIGRMTFTDC